MSSGPESFSTTGRSRKGEPWVWLTAAGLTFGVVMALGLFLLIFIKGTSSFWPRRIEVMEVSQNGQVEKIAGYVTQESERKDSDGNFHEEIQVFRGNKELYGESFKYIDRSTIRKTSRPESIVLVERLDFGPAIVEPVSFETPAGVIAAGSGEFQPEMEKALEQAATARKQLLVIENKKIGANARELDALARAEKVRCRHIGRRKRPPCRAPEIIRNHAGGGCGNPWKT